MSTAEILIVGSGPTGLILALSLARNGVPVRVIEKTKTHRIGQRGAGIQPRSLELFQALGIVDDVIKRAISIPILCTYKMPEGNEVLNELQITQYDQNPSTPYPNTLLLGQENLDKMLRAELEKHGVSVELGAELQSLTQFDHRVDVKILRHSLDDNTASEPVVEEASYKWVVGADGARGVVRKQLGLSFLGDTTEQRFVVGDIQLQGLSTDRLHKWGDLANILTTIRPTETPGLYWFLIGGGKLGDPAEVSASEDAVKKWLKKGTGKMSENITFGEVVCMANYTINIRMTDTFQKGRVFLAGDAGHVHSPAGGQGLNTGVQDAFNLAWKLALVVKGLAPPTLLESFNEERLPVVSEMLNITTSLMKKMIAKGEGWNRGRDLHQLGVNYRWSAVVVDEEAEATGAARAMGSSYDIQAGDSVYAGDRAPDAPGHVMVGGQSGEEASPTTLFKLWNPARHTVLILSNKVDPMSVIASLEKQPKNLINLIVVVKAGEGSSISGENLRIFEDRDGHLHDAYKGAEGKTGIFVIRPDGVIGCRAGSTDGVERYFQGVFGKSV